MHNILSKDMVAEWGLSALPEIKQVEMVDRIGRLMYQALLVRSLDILSETEQTEFDLLLDEDNTTPQEVLGFLKTKIPTFDQMVIEERDKLPGGFLEARLPRHRYSPPGFVDDGGPEVPGYDNGGIV